MPRVRRFDVFNGAAVYALTCNDEVIYCGASTQVATRIHHHWWRLCKGKHKSPAVQELFNKEGMASFGFKVLEYVPASQLKQRETYWTSTFPGLLNAMPMGGAWSPETLKKKSDKAKRQMSNAAQKKAATDRCLENSKAIALRRKLDKDLDERMNAHNRANGQKVKSKFQDPAYAKAHSNGLRERWANPEYKARLSKRLKAAWERRRAEGV